MSLDQHIYGYELPPASSFRCPAGLEGMTLGTACNELRGNMCALSMAYCLRALQNLSDGPLD